MNSYVVMNENALGLIRDDRPNWLEVLAGSVLKGGPNPMDGPKPIGGLDVVRPATQADFDAFRVCSKYHLKGE